VERLPECVEYVICDVDDVVDWSQTDGCQTVFEPLGALGYFDAADGQTAVSGTRFGISDLYSDGFTVAVGLEVIDRRASECFVPGVAVDPGGYVARHAVV
jgi:hypothetical protein